MKKKKLIAIISWGLFLGITVASVFLFFYARGEDEIFLIFMAGVLAGIAYFALVSALTNTFPKLEKWGTLRQEEKI